MAKFLRDHVLSKKTGVKKKSEHFSWKKYCLSPCPKRIRQLIKTLFKNSFSTNFQGTGPWEGPVHFSRFVLRFHSCSKLFQSWSWSQEKKEKPFTKAIEKFKVQAFPKRIRPLIKPLLKNSFSTNFQGTGPWEGPVHFSRFVLRFHSCSKLFQSWSWVHLPLPLPLPFPLPLSVSVHLPLPLPIHLPLPLSLCASSSLSLFLFLFLFLVLVLFLLFFFFFFLFLFLFLSLSLSFSFSFSFSLVLSL